MLSYCKLRTSTLIWLSLLKLKGPFYVDQINQLYVYDISILIYGRSPVGATFIDIHLISPTNLLLQSSPGSHISPTNKWQWSRSNDENYWGKGVLHCFSGKVWTTWNDWHCTANNKNKQEAQPLDNDFLLGKYSCDKHRHDKPCGFRASGERAEVAVEMESPKASEREASWTKGLELKFPFAINIINIQASIAA